MNDALDVTICSLSCGVFREFGERAGLWHERVDKVASHGISDAAQSAQSDAVGRLGTFEFLNGLPRRAQVLADFR
jgi:hypothetical protein